MTVFNNKQKRKLGPTRRPTCWRTVIIPACFWDKPFFKASKDQWKSTLTTRQISRRCRFYLQHTHFNTIIRRSPFQEILALFAMFIQQLHKINLPSSMQLSNLTVNFWGHKCSRTTTVPVSGYVAVDHTVLSNTKYFYSNPNHCIFIILCTCRAGENMKPAPGPSYEI